MSVTAAPEVLTPTLRATGARARFWIIGIALIVLVAGMWVLRWPVRYGAQWIGEQVLRIFARRG